MGESASGPPVKTITIASTGTHSGSTSHAGIWKVPHLGLRIM